MALAPSRSSFSIIVVSVFAASDAFDVALVSAASVTSVALVTSLFFDLSSVALVLSNPTL